MKATAFYFNQKINGYRFHTPYKDAIMYTYEAGTTTLADTYSDSEGTLNSNPIQLSSEGSANVFIEQGKAYKYVFYKNGENIAQYDNIKQLIGEDGGPPAPFNPTPEELAKYVGRDGVQGLSVIGPEGKIGKTGRQGPDFYTAVSMINNQEIEIPESITEIFITATGGGGAGANYTNCIFLYDVLSSRQTSGNELAANYKYSEDSTTIYQSKNASRQQDRDLAGLYFLPGSGYAGQSVYRFKYTFSDTTKSHKIQTYIGNGGKHSTTLGNLNGGNGESTKIYIDGKLVLELAGGVGGKQQMPSQTVPFVNIASYNVTENQGANTGVIYLKLTMSQYDVRSQNDFFNNNAGNTVFYETSYHKTTGNLWTNTPIWVQLYFKEQSVIVGANYSCAFPLSQTDNLKGGENVFSTYYNQYQSYNNGSMPWMSNSKKTTNGMIGKGAGGDCAYNYNQNAREQSLSISTFGYVQPMINWLSVQRFYFAEKTYLQKIGENILNNFEPYAGEASAYTPGVQKGPTDDYWNSIDALITNLKNKGFVFQGPGLYMLNTNTVDLRGYNNADAFGDDGQDGYVLVEYGNLKDIV